MIEIYLIFIIVLLHQIIFYQKPEGERLVTGLFGMAWTIILIVKFLIHTGVL